MGAKSPEFLSNHVKILHITNLFPNPGLLSSTCKGIESLSLFNEDTLSLLKLELPKLTHLTVHGLLKFAEFYPGTPCFNTITHLHCPFDIPTNFQRDTSKILTHFSCCYREPGDPSTAEAVSHSLGRVLEIILAIPTIRVVVVHVLSKEGGNGTLLSQEEMEGILEGVPLVKDAKVVLAAGGAAAVPVWGSGAGFRWDGDGDIENDGVYRWELAESIVKRREEEVFS